MKLIIAILDYLSGPSGSEEDRCYDLTSARTGLLLAGMRQRQRSTITHREPENVCRCGSFAALCCCRPATPAPLTAGQPSADLISAPHLLTGTRGPKAVIARRRAERREQRTRTLTTQPVPIHPVAVLANRRQKA